MIEIRPLTAEDYDAICEVWKASAVGYKVKGRESRAAFTRQMKSGIQAVFGAEVLKDNYGDIALVGVVIASHDSRKGWISRLGVRPEYQRQGVGLKLVGAAEDWLHKQGMHMIAALVVKDNDASLNLFKQKGYLVDDSYYLTKKDNPDV